MTTPVFQSFIAPARVRPQLWRLALGLLLTLVIYALGIVALIAAIWATTPDPDPELRWIEVVLSADTPRAMLLLLLSFGGMALGPMVAVRLLHRRGAGTLFGRGAIVLRHFAIAAAVAGAGFAVLLSIWLLFNDPRPGLPPATWAAVLPLALLGVALQTGAEEILFRGYMQQQLAARFRSPLVWAVLPSLIFGMLHFNAAADGVMVWLPVGWAVLFGLFAADLTARTGSIGAAWGFHFTNNAVAMTVIATDGTLTGLARYITPYTANDAAAMQASLPLDLLTIAAIWLILRRALAR